jgi:hypothetical protein
MRRIELPLSTHNRYDERPDANGVEHFDQPALRTVGNGDFLAHALGRKPYVQYQSQSDQVTLVSGREFPVAASLLVSNAHQCFDGHVGLRLTPALLMDTIVRELAKEVQRDPERYRKLFTSQPGRTIIRVRDDSLSYWEPGQPRSQWNRTIGMFRDPIRAAVTPETADMFVPDFASATEEDKLVLLLGLMDAASPFYDYRVLTKCGIPVIELDGPAEDWRLLAQRVSQLWQHFPALSDYFHDLVPVLDTVAETAGGGRVDEDFWRSFYKYKEDSGSASASGWITSLFAFEQTPEGPKLKGEFNWERAHNGWGGTRINRFPTGISAIPFIWELTGREIPMQFVSGGLGIDPTESGTLVARLGYAVVNAQ